MNIIFNYILYLYIKYLIIKYLLNYNIITRHYGRVVKAWDLKSHDASRVGSNPAGVEFLLAFKILISIRKNA